MLATHHSPSYINTSGHHYQELEMFHVTWYKFDFNFSSPEFLNILTLFLLVNLKFLSCRAQNTLLETELPQFPERKQVLWEWDSSSRSLVKESVGSLVPPALRDHGCDDMVSIPSNEKKALLLQYLNRVQVTPRDKSLKNPKVQKNTPNLKFTPGVYKTVCACMQVRMYAHYTSEWLRMTWLYVCVCAQDCVQEWECSPVSERSFSSGQTRCTEGGEGVEGNILAVSRKT